MISRLALAALLASALAGGVWLWPANAQHQGHGAAPSAAPSASTSAYRAINDRMHRDMAIRFTGDADADFVRAMIPHHQGAVDMARVVLRHGKDPEIHKLALEVVAAQEKEIAMMREWLRRKGH